MKIYSYLRFISLLIIVGFSQNQTALAQFSNPFGSDKTITQQKQDILKKNDEILKHLYKVQPKAKEAIDKSIGYASFSNFGMKILIAGGGTGSGVVISKSGAKPIYMNMAEVQAGVGLGIKSFQNIFIFQTEAALNDFVNSGWTFGGQVTAGHCAITKLADKKPIAASVTFKKLYLFFICNNIRLLIWHKYIIFF